MKSRLRTCDTRFSRSQQKDSVVCIGASGSLNRSEDIPSEQEDDMKVKPQLRKRVTTTISESFEDVDAKLDRDEQGDQIDDDEAENDDVDEEEEEEPAKRRRKAR